MFVRPRSSGALAVILAVLCLVVPQLVHGAAGERTVKAPHSAFGKSGRSDLMAPLQERGEIRVIVGLQTALEIAESAATSDHIKEQRVTQRQLRVLSRLAVHGFRNVKRLRHHDFMAVTLDGPALAALLADPEVTSVTEDRPIYPVLQETPVITTADKAWATGYRGSGHTIAVIDTGVDAAHPFFTGKIVAEACFAKAVENSVSYCPGGVSPSTAPGSGTSCADFGLGCWHGTHVAGIAAGRFGFLSATTGGMAHDANIIAIQVFQRTCDASGCRIVAYDSDLLAALEHVYSLRNTHSIASVNVSLGGDLYTSTCDASLPAYKTIIGALREANIATVIAAGNSGNASALAAPACVSNAISVGSTTKQNTISSFSNSASFLSLLAPGTSVVSAVPGGGYATANGTSMATPHVAGAWALLKGAKPSAAVDELLSALQTRGLPITDSRNGIAKSLIQVGSTGALSMLIGNAAPTVTLTAPADNTMLAAPATVHLSATASDFDGGVSRVEFYRNGALIQTVSSPTAGVYAFSDMNLGAGTYIYTARAYDNASPSAITTSAGRSVSVSATPVGAVNVAAQVNGGVASASTAYQATFGTTTYTFPPAGAINGDRRGVNWGFGGGWNDMTFDVFPDWLQVNFSGMKTIGEINLFTLQDNFGTAEPTSGMTFSLSGLTDFQVQYWNGGAWIDVPGGNVTGNNFVWRRFAFAPITTDRIRVHVSAARENYSRIVELEAWTAASGTAPPNVAPTINLVGPANNTMRNAPATIDLSATATDPDGTVNRVEFYRNGVLIHTVTTPTSGVYVHTDTNVGVGSHFYSARVYDNAGASADSTTRLVSVSATPVGAVNVAAQANGASATASTAFAATFGTTTYTFPPSGAINGDRRGVNWGFGGGWNDMTHNAYPDWLQVNFNGTHTIGEIDVFTLQDNFGTLDPSPSMTFTSSGITAFQVQYWNGSAWIDVPGGAVTGNNFVWRRFTFSPISTDRIRVLVNGSLENYSRIVELEAWTTTSGAVVPNVPPTINLTAPANNTMLAAPATVKLSATAADSGGSVSRVEFYRNDTLIATVETPASGALDAGTFVHSDLNVPVGSYRYTARVYDSAGAVTTSSARLVSVTATPAGAVNVAAAANGATASASSAFAATFGATTYSFPPAGAINGDRRGVNWGFGGGWNDATADTFPDWLQVDFNGARTIGEINVFTLQDNFGTLEPNPGMTFTMSGLTDFQVQYWNGSSWADVPGGNVSGNRLVWRRFTFAPITTERIRVLVNAALENYSRIVEIEAWTATASAASTPQLSLQPVVSGLASPVGIEHAGDGSGRLFVVQQGGQIKVVRGGSVLPTPFLDVTTLISTGGERGLLGLAFHPDYARNGFFYVNYTRQGDGATVIARYQRSASNPNVADPGSAAILLTVPQPFANHNGGQLRFGPDGYLYIALGDGGSGNDPGNRSQDLGTLLGKMLRIDVNGVSPFAIPPGNPFGNAIWALGLRNPWRFSFDRLTGDLFIADVGQNAWEEINFQAAGTGAGANYGWRVMEGAHCTGLGGGPPCFDASFTPPILEYSHAVGCSVTGGYRYRSAAFPSLMGFFVYGDFCSGQIWGARNNGTGFWTSVPMISSGFNISTFGEDETGELYVAGYNTGTLYQVSAR